MRARSWSLKASVVPLSAILAIAWLAAVGAAQTASDPILDPLAKAREKHDAAIEKAREKFLGVLEKRVESARATGRVEIVDEIKGEVERYKAEGTLPSTPRLGAEVRSYRSEWRLASRTYLAAIQTAERELTRADRLDEARQLQKEREVLESELATDNPAPITPNADPAQDVQPNTVWRGFLRGVAAKRDQGKRVANAGVTLRITERNGDSFRGTFHIDGRDGLAEIEGGIGKTYRTREGIFREFSFLVVRRRGGRGPVGPATTFSGQVRADVITAAQKPFRDRDMGVAAAIQVQLQAGRSR